MAPFVDFTHWIVDFSPKTPNSAVPLAADCGTGPEEQTAIISDVGFGFAESEGFALGEGNWKKPTPSITIYWGRDPSERTIRHRIARSVPPAHCTPEDFQNGVNFRQSTFLPSKQSLLVGTAISYPEELVATHAVLTDTFGWTNAFDVPNVFIEKGM